MAVIEEFEGGLTMCEYCNGDHMTQRCLPDPKGVNLWENGVFTVMPNPHGGHMIANVVDGAANTQYAEIRCCPMCGRKLEG